MAPVKTGDRSDLIYSPARKYGLDRCQGRDRCSQSKSMLSVQIDVVSPVGVVQTLAYGEMQIDPVLLIFFFAMELRMTLTFRMGQYQMLLHNRKPIDEFLCIGNSYTCPICYRLRDIHSHNLHNLDFDLQNGTRSNVNTPFESQ